MTQIAVLGSGCKKCEALEKSVKDALRTLGKTEDVEKITDIDGILAYGVMKTPALVINEKVVVSGRLPESEELKNILHDELK